MPVSFPLSIGWLIALIVLIAVFVIWLTGHTITRDELLALIGGLAVARLIP